MKLVPLSDRVVLKQLEAEEKTKSGIILASGSQEKPQEAEVIAVGPGGMVDGKEVTMQVKAGQKVGEIRDLFGNVLKEYYAEFDGIVLMVTVSLAVREGDPILSYGA